MNKFGRFSGRSNRETKKIIKEDRGVVSRCLAWFGSLGASVGLADLSNNMAVGQWGQTYAVASAAGLIFVGADALLSIEEIAYNASIYNKKKRAVKKYFKSNASFLSNESINEVSNLSFRDKHAEIVKQLYADFAYDTSLDGIRNTLADNGITSEQIALIQAEISNTGTISAQTLDQVFPGKEVLAKVLDVVACDDFARRIEASYKNNVSKFGSRTHLKGCLMLNHEQQANEANFRLTEEQKFIRSALSKESQLTFRDTLIALNNLIQDGEYETASEIQESILNSMNDFSQVQSLRELAANAQQARFNSEITKSARSTSEYTLANWKRHIFPLTRRVGILAKLAINEIQDQGRYRGEIKKHRSLQRNFEKNNRIRSADVYCENGTGFRKIRKAYKQANYTDFIVEYNRNNEEKLPNSFACGFIVDQTKFPNTLNNMIDIIKTINDYPIITWRNGQEFNTAAYLDDPVVIKIHGHTNDSSESYLPLVTLNIDNKNVLKAAILGIVSDLSQDSMINEINNIEFIAGGQSRTIYIPQLQEAIAKYAKGESICDTMYYQMAVNLAQEEKFVRAFERTLPDNVANISDEHLSKTTVEIPPIKIQDVTPETLEEKCQKLREQIAKLQALKPTIEQKAASQIKRTKIVAERELFRSTLEGTITKIDNLVENIESNLGLIEEFAQDAKTGYEQEEIDEAIKVISQWGRQVTRMQTEVRPIVKDPLNPSCEQKKKNSGLEL